MGWSLVYIDICKHVRCQMKNKIEAQTPSHSQHYKLCKLDKCSDLVLHTNNLIEDPSKLRTRCTDNNNSQCGSRLRDLGRFRRRRPYLCGHCCLQRDQLLHASNLIQNPSKFHTRCTMKHYTAGKNFINDHYQELSCVSAPGRTLAWIIRKEERKMCKKFLKLTKYFRVKWKSY